MIRVPVSTIVTSALKELNAGNGSGEAPDAQLMADGVELLNQIFDDWNAQSGSMIYADTFNPYTLTPNVNPQTIGSGGMWNTPQPPQVIKGIQVILTGNQPNPYIYLRPRDAAWWQGQPSPTVTASYPTDFYHDPTWDPLSATPLGRVYLWPVPTTAYQVQVWTRQILAAVTASTTLGLPPGYSYAMRMELAGRWWSALRKQWTPAQEDNRVRAIGVVQSTNNSDPVRIATADRGMPRSNPGGLPAFMWPYGGIR